MTFHVEIVRDFDRSYYANVSLNGDPVTALPEYVDYKTLRKAIELLTEKEMPSLKELSFERMGRKEYATFEEDNEE